MRPRLSYCRTGSARPRETRLATSNPPRHEQ
jgi:hypothetical protein